MLLLPPVANSDKYLHNLPSEALCFSADKSTTSLKQYSCTCLLSNVDWTCAVFLQRTGFLTACNGGLHQKQVAICFIYHGFCVICLRD